MICPNCKKSEMWDNRAKKASGDFKPTGPDYSCKDKESCGYVIWPEKKTQEKVVSYTPAETVTPKDQTRSITGPSDRSDEIARQAAGNAISRLYTGTKIPLVDLMRAIIPLAEFYRTGQIPDEVSDITDEETKDLPF